MAIREQRVDVPFSQVRDRWESDSTCAMAGGSLRKTKKSVMVRVDMSWERPCLEFKWSAAGKGTAVAEVATN